MCVSREVVSVELRPIPKHSLPSGKVAASTATRARATAPVFPLVLAFPSFFFPSAVGSWDESVEESVEESSESGGVLLSLSWGVSGGGVVGLACK